MLPTVNSSFTKGNPGPAAWPQPNVLLPTAWAMQLPLLPAYNPDPQTLSETVTYFLVHQLLEGRECITYLEDPITEADTHFGVSLTLGSVLCLITYSWGH